MSLLRDGEVRRAYLGIGGQTVPLPRNQARALEIQNWGGALVLQVEQGSPAARAGLREGDVVIAIGETEVNAVDDLHRILTESMIGQKSTVTIIRSNRRIELAITFSRRV